MAIKLTTDLHLFFVFREKYLFLYSSAELEGSNLSLDPSLNSIEKAFSMKLWWKWIMKKMEMGKEDEVFVTRLPHELSPWSNHGAQDQKRVLQGWI
ncbi:unnamed protein product [Cuscuta epithymum]|uniref:Uncharacterized protein n=1 Tax=Cuscuta epithymum TaxID=186058 RepID=A0AAV0ED15_9ASTE|nr:unnamed protein product [Cuscuta epithymum]